MDSMSISVYLDHAASTPPYLVVQDQLQRLISQAHGNPSSIHQIGRKSRSLIDTARITIAKLFECQLDEIIFTSGATEAMHLGIVGSFLSHYQPEASNHHPKKIYVSPLVHSCVQNALQYLENNYAVEIKHLPLTAGGYIDVENIESGIFETASHIILEHGNSETGHLQPVAKLGKKINKWKEENKENPKPILIVDAAASAVTEKISLEYQKCDMLILSGEKIGGISGTGVLVKKKSIEIQPLIIGSQEFGFRGGTENIIGIYALGKALEIKEEERDREVERLRDLHSYLCEQFMNKLPHYQVTTPIENNLPHIFHFILPEEKAEIFVQRADLAGFCISAGSACSSGAITGSKALINLGFTEQESQRGVRISFGTSTTKKEINQFLAWMKEN